MADRLAGRDPHAGAHSGAARARLLGSPVAPVAQVGLVIVGVAADRRRPAALPALAQGPPFPVAAQVAVGPLVGEQGGGAGLAARDAGALRAFPALVAERPAVGQADSWVPDLAALPALLDDLGVAAVAAMADPAVGPPGHDLHAGGPAAVARPVLPRAGVAGAADPPFLAQLPEIGGDPPAVGAAGADYRVPSLVKGMGQPQQHRRAEGAARREGVRIGGHVRGQLLQEPGRALHGDRHCGLQQGRGLPAADRGQYGRHLVDCGVHRGLQPGLLAGKPGGR